MILLWIIFSVCSRINNYCVTLFIRKRVVFIASDLNLAFDSHFTLITERFFFYSVERYEPYMTIIVVSIKRHFGNDAGVIHMVTGKIGNNTTVLPSIA